MSIFQTTTVTCPACDAEFTIEVAVSVNADRRPDLRQEIIDGTFQVVSCPSCATSFRLQPTFTYIDVGRRQWILAHPIDALQQWQTLEAEARTVFDVAYGAGAPRLARELGKTLAARIVFGWPALREKLVCRETGLDDIGIELLKLAVIRDVPNAPLADESELRLDRVEDESLTFAWLDSSNETVLKALRMPRAAYSELADDPQPWATLRAQLAGRFFVDVNRLLVTAAP
jgi:uncharacterized Zn-finger protein